LRTHLDGTDPDEAYSIIPYEKGALFLLALEQATGRAAFDRFLRGYIERFRFGALSTEEFVDFASAELAGAFEQVNLQRWLYAPGLPTEAPTPRSSRLEAIQQLHGAVPSDAQAQAWSATEWQLYIESIPAEAGPDDLAEVDRRFQLTASRNDDVAEKWLTLAVRTGYQAALPRVEEMLGRVGRMKYLRPLYRELAQRPETRPLAEAWFAQFAPRYHPIARHVVTGVLSAASSSPS
jgi:aminopeptidase N